MTRARPEKAVRPCWDGDGPHTRILSIACARCELKQLCCYINSDFLVKMSDLSEHSAFGYLKKKKKKKRKSAVVI